MCSSQSFRPGSGRTRLQRVDTQAIADLIRKLEEKGLSASTITNYLKPLNGTLSFAVSQGKLPSNPYLALTDDQRPQAAESEDEDEGRAYEWSGKQIEQLLQASKLISRQHESRYDYYPVIYMAIRTGLRLGELLGLVWRNVDLEDGVMHVRQQYTKFGRSLRKTKKSRRRVPLGPEDVAFLRRLKLASTFSKEEDFVFASRKGTPLSHRNVQRRGFETARDLAELPTEITFHFLRHAFASIAAHRGVPDSVLSEVMGHANVGITRRVYRHLYDREAAEDAFRTAMARGQQ